jgi:2-polyprenyl-6-methoxyphenol hydroxylase-like FAD-dependent oxidoreductase
VGWECPRILDAMGDADDVYFDRVSQIKMDTWTKQRTVLIGDAAACVSLLAGEGTGLAMSEAYVLAGELERSPDDVGAAFARYEEFLIPFLRRKQGAAARFASGFAPRTRVGILARNALTYLLRFPLAADRIIGRDLIDDLALPDYGEDATARGASEGRLGVGN